jgi:hypothetical protein
MPGPKPLPKRLKRVKRQVVLEPAVIKAVTEYADAFNLSFSASARALIIRGYRDATGLELGGAR